MSLQSILPYRLPNLNGRKLADPHVVIIGAGASIAACKKDKFGKEVPVLKNIHHILGLTSELNKYGFTDSEMADFELLYSNIYGKKEYMALAAFLEENVRNYFKELVIPDEATYYDYLILSLTSKDAIISFNWDPFLMQAYRRNLKVGSLPELLFVHGNVGVGVCYKCKKIGYADTLCPVCLEDFSDMPLLFPVGKKDYDNHPVIQFQWEGAKYYLSRAAGITVYGYGAPQTDIEAVELMKTAYTDSNVKDIAPFTIINTESAKEEQLEKWKEFFDSEMMLYCESIEESLLWRNPRVSLENLFDARLQQHPREIQRPFSKFSTLLELQEFVKSINDFDMYFAHEDDM